MSMEIRRMKREEADAVSRVYCTSWKSAYRGLVPQPYLDSLPALRWSPMLAENPSKSLILLKNDRLVGTASFGAARDASMNGWGEIISLYLLPEHMGRGYGTALLLACVRALRYGGFSNLYLWTLEHNLRARAFYEKHGFAPDGAKLTCEIGGVSLTEVRYSSVSQEGSKENGI